MGKKVRVSIFDKLIGKFRIGIEENGVIKTSDGKTRLSKDCPTKEKKPLKQ